MPAAYLLLDVDDPGSATTIGQAFIFITFLINIGVQIFREYRAEKQRHKEKEERAAAEAALQAKLEAQQHKSTEELGKRMDAMRKRLNGLIDEDMYGRQ